MNQRAEADFYNQLSSASNEESVSPHRIVQMLLDGGLERLHRARVALMAGDSHLQAELVLQVHAIIGGLKAGLNLELGGEIARNLMDLYQYIEKRLMSSKIAGDMAIIDEVIGLVAEIKVGWDAIG
ncbi:MAG: flagellar export chaperone FliS [Gammaproteobacteria bacterium]|nr:flagellar export chaperone FliS [Gammaproteobacteria bacterium]